jgi:hypothetical protein
MSMDANKTLSSPTSHQWTLPTPDLDLACYELGAGPIAILPKPKVGGRHT